MFSFFLYFSILSKSTTNFHTLYICIITNYVYFLAFLSNLYIIKTPMFNVYNVAEDSIFIYVTLKVLNFINLYID